MLVLLLVVFAVVFVLSAVVIAVLVKGNESLKAQHRAYVVSVNSVYDDHADIIVGLQTQVDDLLAKREDDQALLAAKDHHTAGLVKETKKATKQVAVLEKLAAEKEAELAEATASEFAAKAKLANAMANYKKVEEYALARMQKSSPSIFEECTMANDSIYIFEDELNIHWFK